MILPNVPIMRLFVGTVMFWVVGLTTFTEWVFSDQVNVVASKPIIREDDGMDEETDVDNIEENAQYYTTEIFYIAPESEPDLITLTPMGPQPHHFPSPCFASHFCAHPIPGARGGFFPFETPEP